MTVRCVGVGCGAGWAAEPGGRWYVTGGQHWVAKEIDTRNEAGCGAIETDVVGDMAGVAFHATMTRYYS